MKAILLVALGGVLAGLAEKHELFTAGARLLLFTGLLGGFPTFSAFGLGTMWLGMGAARA